MRYQSDARSDRGRARPENEDAIFASDERALYIVCDGMGGHHDGEVAARIACDAVRTAFGGAPPAVDDTVARLRKKALDAAHAANDAVWAEARRQPAAGRMGTTLSFVVFVGRRAVIGHVGDSRIYLMRDGAVQPLTEDHTGVQELVAAGVLSEAEAKKSPFASVLTRAVGTAPAIVPDALVVDVLAGDRFVLCSDGLTRYLFDRRSMAALVSGRLEGSATRLVELANAAGGQDNISVVVVDAVGDAAPERKAGLDARLASLASAFGYQDIQVSTLQRLLNVSTVRRLEAGERLEPTTMTCVVDGALEANGAPLGAGDVVGKALLLAPGEAVEPVVATAPTEVLEVDRSKFWRLLARRPLWGLGVLRRLGSERRK